MTSVPILLFTVFAFGLPLLGLWIAGPPGAFYGLAAVLALAWCGLHWIAAGGDIRALPYGHTRDARPEDTA